MNRRTAFGFTFLVTGLIGCDRLVAGERAMLDQLAAMNAAAAVPIERGELVVEEAEVAGDIGAVSAFSAPADSVVATYDPEFRTTNISLHATDRNGRVGMIILNVEGTDLRDLEPGTYEFGGAGVGKPFPATITVTGCSSDPACPSCDYDAPGNKGVIIIEEPDELPDFVQPPHESGENVPPPAHKRDMLVEVDLPRPDGSFSQGHAYFVMR